MQSSNRPAAKRSKPPEAVVKPAERMLLLAENSVYAIVGVVLVASAVVALATLVLDLVQDLFKGPEKAVLNALDGLLLVFILLELLGGLRATMTERRLVAEPFLIVGIIASIKEIVVVALGAKESLGKSGPAFDDAMLEIGVLAGVVILLSLASFMVRLKEREPEEGDD